MIAQNFKCKNTIATQKTYVIQNKKTESNDAKDFISIWTSKETMQPNKTLQKTINAI